MKKIVLVGCGELGSRHLQALASSKEALSVHAVDPSETSLEVARERCAQVTPGHLDFSVRYSASIADVDSPVDVAIVATTSGVRLRVMRELVEHTSVANLVLEKFLFSKEQEYEEASAIVRQLSGNAWVNCPRRQYPVYEKLREEFGVDSNIDVTVSGPNWGMACNSIHFVDLVSHLTGSPLKTCSFDEAGARAIASKREGFQEFLGTLRGEMDSGSTFSLTATDSDEALQVALRSTETELTIHEGARQYTRRDTGTGETSTHEFPIFYQSQLTQLVVADIASRGACALPTYAESAALHRVLLATFQSLNTTLNGAQAAPLQIT